MESSVTHGTWWLPEYQSQRRVAGALVAESSSFRLVLQDSLRHYEAPEPIDGAISHRYGGPQRITVPVIYGYTDDRKQVTILGASGDDMAGPFEAVQESYDVNIALFGDHIADAKFIEASVEFDWLDAWLDPPSISGDRVGELDLSIVQTMPIEIASAAVEGGRIAFKVGVVGTENASAVHVDRTSSVHISFDSPQDWRDVLNM